MLVNFVGVSVPWAVNSPYMGAGMWLGLVDGEGMRRGKEWRGDGRFYERVEKGGRGFLRNGK